MRRYAVHTVIFADAKNQHDAIVDVRTILRAGLFEASTDGEDFRIIRAEPFAKWAK